MDVKLPPEGPTNNVHLKAKDYPTPSAQYIAEQLIPEWLDLFLRRNAGYGEMHKELGLVAQYVDMHRKFGKVRRAIWDKEPIGEEGLREVLMDLIGHCFLTIDLIDESGGEHDRP